MGFAKTTFRTVINLVTIVFIGVFIMPACRHQKLSDVWIDDARLNGETNPTGIDIERPDFSWKLKSEKRNRYQSAYQIVVLSDATKDTCWNSGKIISNNNILVKYSGKPLESVHSYRWKVKIWDKEGKSSSWSDEYYFTTGLFNENEWTAQWISSPDSVYSPLFLKEFIIDEIPNRATVFVNCQGYYELYINGEKVGNDVLSPAVSNFRFENYYLTYDIKKHLKAGKNTIGMWTGRGWYSWGLPGVIHKSPVFRLQAYLSTDQNSTTIVSDTTWKTTESNIKQIGQWRWNKMGGELIDSRISISEWLEGKIGKNWKNAIRIPKPRVVTKSQICRPNVITDTITVKDISQIDNNVWLVDFGKNFSGWMKIKIKNQIEGDTTNFIYSDFCDQKPEKLSNNRWDFGNSYIDQRDAYVSSNADSGVFCHRFNFHAFRYVIIEGLNYKPQASDISGYMIESDLLEAGSFTSSDKDLNAIYDLNRYTFRCLDNGGYYVDCPHRERLGYGDGQVAIETGIYSFDLRNFYKKWAKNWRVEQDSTGYIPTTAPSPYFAGGGPGWGGTAVVLPWKIYKYYGDIAFLENSFEIMEGYVDFLESKSKGGYLEKYGHEVWGFLGDWVPPREGMDASERPNDEENELFNNCYKLYLYDILAKSSQVLDKTGQYQKYDKLATVLRQKINDRYYNSDSAIYASGEQSYLSFPLLLDVPDKNERHRVMKRLEHEIRVKDEGHLNTGMLGTYFMLQYLTESDRSDLVYLMMKQKTFPGWGYMIAQGATTCWEQWNGFWSNIHSCFTSGGGWFYTGVAGIRQMNNSVAFKHLLIAPQLTNEISEQSTQFNSPYGKVLVSWTHNDNSDMHLEIEIPVNTKADVVLPVSEKDIVYESDKLLSSNNDIEILDKGDYNLRVSIASGKYVFEIKGK